MAISWEIISYKGGGAKGRGKSEIYAEAGGNILLKGNNLQANSGDDFGDHQAKVGVENAILKIELTGSMSLKGSEKNLSEVSILGLKKNELTLMMGKDLTMDEFSSISQESKEGKISIIVDQNYSTYPQTGLGGMHLSKNAMVSSPTLVSLYLGHPDNSSFESDINGTTSYTPPYNSDKYFYDTYYPKENPSMGSTVVFYYKVSEPGLMTEGILSYGLFLSSIASGELFSRLNDVAANRVFYPNLYAEWIEQYESFSIRNEVEENVLPQSRMQKVWVGQMIPSFLKKTFNILRRL